jgi:hypothetical protein
MVGKIVNRRVRGGRRAHHPAHLPGGVAHRPGDQKAKPLRGRFASLPPTEPARYGAAQVTGMVRRPALCQFGDHLVALPAIARLALAAR